MPERIRLDVQAKWMMESNPPGRSNSPTEIDESQPDLVRRRLPVPAFDEAGLELDLAASGELTSRADRRNTFRKFAAGCRGIKHAARGDSSFFVHGYRGTLIAITAALLQIDQWGWCLLVISASFVLIAELTHSAIDTLARAIGDPEEPRLNMAREMAAGGVLVAAFGMGTVTVIVLGTKLGKYLGWWP
jgi:diacylglycerol kinase (ATP)